MNKRIVNLLRIIALIEFLLGLILFSKEIINYIHLPTIQEVDNQFGGLVDFFKYKESCYKNLFLYSLLIITGLSFWMSKKLYWGLTQILLTTLFFVTIINLWFVGFTVTIVTICLTVFALTIFIYLEIKICNPLLLKVVGINKAIKYLSFLGSGLSCLIWFMLFWT